MSLASLINRPCTLLRLVETDETDEYGNPISTIERIETVCELQRVTRRVTEEERDQYGEMSDTLWTLFFLPGLDLSTGDAVEVDGTRYELVSAPAEWRNPRTRSLEYVQAVVRLTAGAGDLA